MTLFITPNQYKRAEVATLLQGLDVEWRRLGLPAVDGPLRARAFARGVAAWDAVGEPCFVEVAELEAGGEVLTGAAFKKRLDAEGREFFVKRAGPARAGLAVALATGADAIEVFEGHLEGELVAEPRGEGGFGWDAHFVPEGTPRTLAELADQKAWVGFRVRPYLELAERLRGREYGGVFEAHITVNAVGDERGRFIELCEALDVKAIVIALERGTTPVQPMSASYHRGALAEVQLEVFELARRIAGAGFDVSRVKIEATGGNRELPDTDADAAARPELYFEFHVKVSLPADADHAALAELCASHDAHLSRNARRVTEGRRVHFVTQRAYGLGRANATDRFHALHRALKDAGYELSHVLVEYTVYDSNVHVDHGWLTA